MKYPNFRHAFKLSALTLALMFVVATSATAADICGVPQVSTLWAGQTINAGTVTVSNDEDNLYVTYATQNGWLLTEVHLYVLDEEPTQRLTPGQAPYKSTLMNATTYTFTVPLTGATCGETTKWLQAHASVVKLDNGGTVVDSQTAYGGTVTKPNKGSWYGNISYTIQCCEPNGGEACTGKETAFGGETKGGNWQPWWYYYDNTATGGGSQTIWAGQTINVGDVTVSCTGNTGSDDCTIKIFLTGGWGLQAVDESVKIQGYIATSLPTSRPIAGQFTTYKGTDLEVTVSYYPYYVIHLDVGQPDGCDPTLTP